MAITLEASNLNGFHHNTEANGVGFQNMSYLQQPVAWVTLPRFGSVGVSVYLLLEMVIG